MLTKLIRIGNSYGVIIPKKIVDDLAINAGQKIVLEYDRKKQRIIIHLDTDNSGKTTS